MTAWSPPGVRRSRSAAVLWRVVGLGLFLLCLVFTHAAAPDVTGRHLVADSAAFGLTGTATGTDAGTGTVTGIDTVQDRRSAAPDALPASGASGDHHHDHRQHTVEECALGQPPQGPDVDVPCLSPLAPERTDGAPALTRAPHLAGRDFVVPIAHAADTTILRV